MINIAKSDLFIYSNDDLDPVSENHPIYGK